MPSMQAQKFLICREKGLIKERGKQRTDSTHIEAAIRLTNRLVNVGETLQAALNSLAVVVPDWLRAHTPQGWYDRYGERIEDFHMPKEATKSAKILEQIGCDGFQVMKWVREEDAAIWLREIPALEILRQVWIQQELESKQLLPSEHYMDAGYMDAEHLFTSEKHYAIELIDPLAKSGGWQMGDMKAYDNSKFAADWSSRL